MSTFLFFVLPAILIFAILLPFVPIIKGVYTGKKAKKSLVLNLCSFVGIVALMIILPIGDIITFAAGAENAAEAVSALSTGKGLAYIGAGLACGLAALGAGVAVASAAPAAIGATTEDPKNFGKAMIFVVLGEGVAIYGLLIAIMIISNL